MKPLHSAPLTITLALLFGLTVACHNKEDPNTPEDGPAEEAGEEVDDAAEDVDDAAEDAADEAEDAVDEADD